MVVHAINVRQKGQVTLPADVREDLGVRDGGKLLLERRGNEWVLLRPEDLVDQLSGSLSQYVGDESLNWDRDELWTEIASEREDRALQHSIRKQDDE